MISNVHQAITEKMVMASTEFGIAVVQEIATQSLMQKPSMSLREFTKVLQQHVENTNRVAAKNNPG